MLIYVFLVLFFFCLPMLAPFNAQMHCEGFLPIPGKCGEPHSGAGRTSVSPAASSIVSVIMLWLVAALMVGLHWERAKTHCWYVYARFNSAMFVCEQSLERTSKCNRGLHDTTRPPGLAGCLKWTNKYKTIYATHKKYQLTKSVYSHM